MSLDSLPLASQAQIAEMQKNADKLMKANNEPVLESQQQLSSDSLETEEASATDTADAESAVQETSPAEEPAPAATPKQRAYSKEENMALLRERTKRAEAEREELARQLQAYQAKISQNPSQPNQEPEEFSMAPDELAEGKHIAKLQKKIKSLEDKMQQSNQYSSSAAAETRLRMAYPDFDKVVSQSNIAALSEMFPDVAKTIGDSKDLYSKAVTAYTVIKNLGIYQDDFQQEKKVAATNAAKPRPLTSISPQQGDTPLSRVNAFANGLTDDLRKSLQKEMFEAMKNRY
jgi:chromosome segregation ATPase